MKPLHKIILACVIACTFMPMLTYGQFPPFDWGKRIAGPLQAFRMELLQDENHNIYISGIFEDSTDLDPGPGVDMAYSNGNGYFLQKYDPNGNYLFSIYYAHTTFNIDMFTSIAVDHSGNIYTVGSQTSGTLDLDPGSGTSMFSAVGDRHYILKFDANGNFQSVSHFTPLNGSTFGAQPIIRLDQFGNLYTALHIGTLVDVDPGPAMFLLTASSPGKVALVKWDSNMHFVWAFAVGGAQFSTANNLEIDPQGEPVISGNFKGVIDLDPGPGNANYNGIGKSDLLYAKYSTSGTLVSSGAFGSTTEVGEEYIWDCSIDHVGNIYFCGHFLGMGDFDPNVNSYTWLGAPHFDGEFMIRLRPDGSFAWGKTWQSTALSLEAVATDAMHHVYPCFSFVDTFELDPGTGLSYSTIDNQLDLLVVKMDTTATVLGAMQVGGTQSQRSPKIEVGPTGTIALAGLFNNQIDLDSSPTSDSIINNAYWTSIFLARYGWCLPETGTAQVTSCPVVSVHGDILPGPGIYNVVVPQPFPNCDSVYVVTVLPGPSSTGTASAHGCNNITVNGHFYQNAGTYTQHLINAIGCDSAVTLTITLDSINTQLNVQGQTLTAVLPSGSYQWVYCDSGYAPIVGETQQSFTPLSTGNYAVIVNDGNCQDTSQCQSMTVAVTPSFALSKIAAWPNPVSDAVNVSIPDGVPGLVQIKLMNAQGQVVSTQEVTAGERVALPMPAVVGIYLLQAISEVGVVTLTLLKQ